MLLVCANLLAQPTASVMPMPHIQFFNKTGQPLAGGLVYTYQTGTLIPQATYKDAYQVTANSNPVVLDSGGYADIWLASGQSYRIVVASSANVTQSTTDNVSDPYMLNQSNFAVLNSTATQTFSGPVSTGTYGLTGGAINISGNGKFGSIDGVQIFCDIYSGTMDQQMQSCISAVISAGGGVADGRGITSISTTQYWNRTVTIQGASVTVLLGAVNPTLNAWPVFKILGNGSGSEVVRIFGQGPDSSGTVFTGGGSGTLIQLGDGTSTNDPSKVEVAGLYLNGTNQVACITGSYVTMPWIHDNQFVNCLGGAVVLHSSSSPQIGPRNDFGTVTTNSLNIGSIVLDNAPNAQVYANNFYPANSPGIRFTNTPSTNVRSANNSFLSQTFAFEIPLMSSNLIGFSSVGDNIVNASLGWADVGLLVDGSGAAVPINPDFEHLYVGSTPATATTTITAAQGLKITDSYITPATIIAGATVIPYSPGVTTFSQRDNVWVGGLTNAALSFSDLSAGKFVIGALQYTGSSVAQVGPSLPTTGTGSVWTNPNTGVSTTTLSTMTFNSSTPASGLYGANLGFSIPTSSVITGIQVTFQRFLSGGVTGSVSASSGQVCLQYSSTQYCKSSSSSWTWAQANETEGSSSDTWGNTWTAQQINDPSFGLSITPSFIASTGYSRVLNLGYYQITIYYNSGGTLVVPNLSVPGQQVNIQGPTTPAVLAVTTNSGSCSGSSCVVTGCSVVSGGTGYPFTPNVVIGGNGTGATAVVTMVGGVVKTCAVTNSGSYYTVATIGPQAGSYATMYDGLILQWASGVSTTAATGSGSGQTQVIQFPYTFPHACLNANIATQVAAATPTGTQAMYQQVGACTAANVEVLLEQFTGSVTGSTYIPTVLAIGW